MKLTDIIKTQKEILRDGHSIENNIIEEVDINVISRFGNCPCFEISCSNVDCFSGYDNTQNLGFLIQAFYNLFELNEEDSLRLNEIKKIPCRLIFKEDGSWGDKCIGFGHFMENKFVYSKDFTKINEY